MTISEKQFAVLLLFFLLTIPSSTAEMESATIESNPNSSFDLSDVYLSSFLIHLSFLAFWIRICIQTRPSVRRTHMLMAGLILLKAVTLICKYFEVFLGTHGSDLFFYISPFIICVFRLSIVIQLLTTGWSLMAPFSKKVDRVCLMVSIPLQIFADIVEIVIGENVDIDDWNNLKIMLEIVEFITCSFAFLPILSSKFSLGTDGMAPRNLEKLERFRVVFATVMLYLLFLRALRLWVWNNGYDELKNAINDGNLIWKTTVWELFGLLMYMTLCDKIMKYFVHVDQDQQE